MPSLTLFEVLGLGFEVQGLGFSLGFEVLGLRAVL